MCWVWEKNPSSRLYYQNRHNPKIHSSSSSRPERIATIICRVIDGEYYGFIGVSQVQQLTQQLGSGWSFWTNCFPNLVGCITIPHFTPQCKKFLCFWRSTYISFDSPLPKEMTKTPGLGCFVAMLAFPRFSPPVNTVALSLIWDTYPMYGR